YGFDHRAAVWLWQLYIADSDRRRRYGLSCAQHALLLGYVLVSGSAHLGIFRDRRGAHLGLDRLSDSERTRADRWPRTRRGADVMGDRRGGLLYWRAARGSSVHYHDGGPARQGRDLGTHAAYR